MYLEPLPIAILLTALLIFLIHKRATPNRSKLPPSPTKLPIIGNLHQLGTRPHRGLHALSQKYGPLMLLKLGSVPTIIVSSAEVAQEVMRTQDSIFASRPSLELAKQLLYNCRDMAFAPYGEYWRQIRKLCIVHLLSAKRVQSFSGVRDEEISQVIDRIACCSAVGPVNLSKILNSLSSGLIARIAFGRKFLGEERSKKAQELVEETSALFGGFYVRDYFPWLGWLGKLGGMDGRVKRCFINWDALLEEVIRDHEDRKRDQFGADQNEDLVDVLLALQKDRTEGFTLARDEIKAIILELFVAGTDTSYIALEWAMAELVRSPKRLKIVQDEVREILGNKSKVKEDDISKMSYLKAVIKESLRLHPPLPLLVPRESLEATKLQGYEIPRNTRILVNAWSIGQDPTSWEEAREFRPERFLNNLIDFKGNDFHFIPFGAGRRICPGMHFAISTIELALANLLYRFDWNLPNNMSPEDLDMVEAYGISTRMKSNLLLHAIPYKA
ncbi:cytochrome P450 71A1-like [Phoenix dactylifera]|uniref:Cytochrome P450 71A1-like n=1 Tax=Phoenix dactylifera TaxID=42345 RepID=A0A8B7D0W4_PHODC|nr:cytochrome P450 71A1-like [Phoenix dactylifera]